MSRTRFASGELAVLFNRIATRGGLVRGERRLRGNTHCVWQTVVREQNAVYGEGERGLRRGWTAVFTCKKMKKGVSLKQRASVGMRTVSTLTIKSRQRVVRTGGGKMNALCKVGRDWNIFLQQKLIFVVKSVFLPAFFNDLWYIYKVEVLVFCGKDCSTCRRQSRSEQLQVATVGMSRVRRRSAKSLFLRNAVKQKPPEK